MSETPPDNQMKTRTIELNPEDSAIILKGKSEAAFTVDLYASPQKSSGTNTAVLISWMIQKNDHGLRMLLKRASKKFLKQELKRRNQK